MMNTINNLNKTDKLLLKSDLYRLIAGALSYPETEKIANIKVLAQNLIDMPLGNEDINILVEKFEDLCVEETVLNDYNRIFLKGAVPLNESHTLQKFNSVSDVNAFYAAFGFNPKTGEAPDSIMHELEFAGLLYLKIAIAPNAESAEITEDALKLFMNDHLIEFGLKLADKIKSGDSGAFFYNLADLIELVMNEEKTIYQNKN